MGRFVKGDVVIIPFPFSDLSNAKRRPELILAELQGDDLILCQITSQNIRDSYAIALNEPDFQAGSLKQSSNIRPNRLFTADSSIILYKAGHIAEAKLRAVIDQIIGILES